MCLFDTCAPRWKRSHPGRLGQRTGSDCISKPLRLSWKEEVEAQHFLPLRNGLNFRQVHLACLGQTPTAAYCDPVLSWLTVPQCFAFGRRPQFSKQAGVLRCNPDCTASLSSTGSSVSRRHADGSG